MKKFIDVCLKLFFVSKTLINNVLIKWRIRPAPLYSVLYVEDLPDELKQDFLYLLGGPGKEWLAVLSCPCKCGERIELVLNGRSPSWKFSMSDKGIPSLFPSIYRSVNCRSHFFLIKGRIQWCKF